MAYYMQQIKDLFDERIFAFIGRSDGAFMWSAEEKEYALAFTRRQLAQEVAEHVLNCACLEGAVVKTDNGYRVEFCVIAPAKVEQLLQIVREMESASTSPAAPLGTDGWVPVSQLPPVNSTFQESVFLLCWEEDIGPFIGWYDAKGECWLVAHHTAPSTPRQVTHWRQLPEAPEEPGLMQPLGRAFRSKMRA